MNTTVSTAQITDYLSRHLSDVFETMLSLKATITPRGENYSLPGDRVTGSVGMAGSSVTGSVYLHLTAAFAGQAAAAMLGLKAEELATDEVNDVIGEVTNMLAGGLKSWLCDAGATCALTAPAVIRGSSFQIKPKPGGEAALLAFTCGDTPGFVEVHLKFN